MSTTSNHIVSDPWLSLDYELSIYEMRKLGYALGRVNAIEWIRAEIKDPDGPIDRVYVERLAFQKWRYVTGRLCESHYVTHQLSEFVGTGL